MNNNHSEPYTGLMPIRVLQNNLIYAFENLNPEFIELSERVIKKLQMDPGISYDFQPSPAKSPYVIFRKIHINESFLSYVWCICFSLSVLYEEVIVKKSHNDYFGNTAEKINKPLVEKAFKIWDYAISLLKKYSDWKRELPNPELEDSNKDLILQINGLYITAMKFILAHEFAHIELEHDSNIITGESTAAIREQNIVFEKEADARAIKLTLQGKTPNNSLTTNMGILMGLCSLLFFNSNTKGDSYPDTDERIDNFITIVNSQDESDPIWGIATLAYKLWDRLFTKGLVFKDGLSSPKELYYSIKAQIEKLK